MRLVDLEPRWVKRDDLRGVSFICPDHGNHRLAIWFGIQWTASGHAFETLTISPSIDARPAGCGHFNVINGDIVPA